MDDWFDAKVSLPPGLTISSVRRSVEYIERELAELVEIYFEQMNVFSAIRYFRDESTGLGQQLRKVHRSATISRFNSSRIGPNPSPEDSLESKASKRPWALQSHYDHPGWYIVWRYLVDSTETLETDKPVIIWRVDVAFLDRTGEASRAGPSRGGRTHTFGLHRPATKLRDKAMYRRGDVVLVGGKPVPVNGD